jgi:hypothetical protein
MSCRYASCLGNGTANTAVTKAADRPADDTSCSSDSEHSNHSDDSSWERSIEDQVKRDTRKQPWKKTFGDKVDNAFDEERDLSRIDSSAATSDLCPEFQTQLGTLAA